MRSGYMSAAASTVLLGIAVVAIVYATVKVQNFYKKVKKIMDGYDE